MHEHNTRRRVVRSAVVALAALLPFQLALSSKADASTVGRPVWKYTYSPTQGPCISASYLRYVSSGTVNPNSVVYGKNYRGYKPYGDVTNVLFWDYYSFDRYSIYEICQGGHFEYEWDRTHDVIGCHNEWWQGAVMFSQGTSWGGPCSL